MRTYKVVSLTNSLFLITGKGFVSECIHKGTTFTTENEVKEVVDLFERLSPSVEPFFSKWDGESPEWPCCNCDDCTKSLKKDDDHE